MLKNKFTSIAAGAAATVMVAVAPVASVLADSNSNAHNKVTICHATGSQSNPYVVITPNANGVVSGHVAHQDQRDIIPPFSYNDHGTTKQFAGQNWDASGQAIFNNGCKVASTNPGGGGGGGGGGGTTETGTTPGQVLAANTGGQAAQVQTPQGAVGAGFGGASVATNPVAVIGLGSSLLSLGAGLALFNRRASKLNL
jgi:hypothetical protein